jgi:hypothetical protein
MRWEVRDMAPSLEFCSLHYLNQWFYGDRSERSIRGPLLGDNEDEVLSAIHKAVGSFWVARTLHRKFDTGVGLKRYEPLLYVLKSIDRANSIQDSFVNTVEETREKISARYGGRDVLSLTTKLLWLLFQDPFIIFHNIR